MFAIVEIKGKQYKVEKGRFVYVDYIKNAEQGQELVFDKVLLLAKDENDILVGTPKVENASVKTEVLDHVKGDKIIVFKKKRRKGYKVKKGHRQPYTKLMIKDIVLA